MSIFSKQLKQIMYESSKISTEISENDHLRSDFIRTLVQAAYDPIQSASSSIGTIPKIIIQYWDAPENLPEDVRECIDSWSPLEAGGFRRILFDEHSARLFIAEMLSEHHLEAFDRCYHPAMKSDFFRLCYVSACGGIYVDVDDAYRGTDLDYLFVDNKLKLQPLCYDCETGLMVKPSTFMSPCEHSNSWIYYFNNNPIIASPGDPILDYALCRATEILVNMDRSTFPEIQSTTGPGNLTASLVALAARNSYQHESRLLILSDWDSHARTVWPLSYREDTRNWRLSNRQRFLRKQ